MLSRWREVSAGILTAAAERDADGGLWARDTAAGCPDAQAVSEHDRAAASSDATNLFIWPSLAPDCDHSDNCGQQEVHLQVALVAYTAMSASWPNV